MGKDLTERIGYIYKLTAPNGKIYIGQTICLKDRKCDYNTKRFQNQIKLWNSCQKYNWNPKNTFEVIEECKCGPNKIFLNEREIYWIQFYNSVKEGLNCNDGGDGNIGYSPSEETRKKLSLANKGQKRSVEFCKKISESLKGKKRSKESIDKQIKKQTGRKQSEETINKRTNKLKGKKHSEETKFKISNNKKGTPPWNKGIPRSEETKQKMRETIKNKKDTP